MAHDPDCIDVSRGAGRLARTLVVEPGLDAPINLPRLPKLTEVQQVAHRSLCDGHTVMPGAMRGLRRHSEVRVMPSTLWALHRLGLCSLRRGPLGVLMATLLPHR